MDKRYSIANPEEVLSPGLLVFEEIVRENMVRMREMAGSSKRLRPHCKTHKMVDVVRMEVEMAIPTHICPTSALHSHVWVASGGRVRERWEVTARDRALYGAAKYNLWLRSIIDRGSRRPTAGGAVSGITVRLGWPNRTPIS